MGCSEKYRKYSNIGNVFPVDYPHEITILFPVLTNLIAIKIPHHGHKKTRRVKGGLIHSLWIGTRYSGLSTGQQLYIGLDRVSLDWIRLRVFQVWIRA
jgi:hypothetical protein